MDFRAFLEFVTSRFVVLPAALAGLLAALWLVPFDRPAPPLSPVEMASPAQMQQAMERLNEDHEAVTEFLQHQQIAEDRKEAERVKALDAARDRAANEARRKAEAEAREAALKAAAQRKLVEESKQAPRVEKVAQAPATDTVPVADKPVANPLPITPPVPAAAPRRGPIDQAIAKANELTDRTLAAADAVRDFVVSAAGRLIGGVTGSPTSNLTSSY